jgi:hypothetical protein
MWIVKYVLVYMTITNGVLTDERDGPMFDTLGECQHALSQPVPVPIKVDKMRCDVRKVLLDHSNGRAERLSNPR